VPNPIYIVVVTGLIGTIATLILSMTRGREQPPHRVPWIIALVALGLDSAVHVAISDVNARFVILDALDDVLDGRLDSHKSASIRQALSPINQVANEAKCAILGVTHLNKSSSTDFIYRILGSTAYTAAARSVIGVFPDPTDDSGETKLVRVGKSNLGVIPREAEVIRIVSTPVNTDTGIFDIGRVEVMGTREVDVDELLTTVDENDVEDISDAGRWLLKHLANQGGEASRQDIIEAGRKAGYSKDQLVRARKRAGITPKRQGSFGAPTTWYHPGNAPQPCPPDESPGRYSMQSMHPRTNCIHCIEWGQFPGGGLKLWPPFTASTRLLPTRTPPQFRMVTHSQEFEVQGPGPFRS
jgi:hypothetical protein